MNPVLGVALTYVAALFALAWYVDRRAARGGGEWVGSPVIYTLSLSVYCTAWTFYGAVGSAARSGVEFMTIYLGPTLAFIGWWWLIRKLVRIGRTHRITSIADMISSRYGKSGSLAAIATVVAVLAATPYIALQLQSLTLSYETITGGGAEQDARIAFWAAAGLALFTILFGTRTLDENERHHGVVAAIAAEAVVKLAAVIAVGIFAVFTVAGGIENTFADVTAESLQPRGHVRTALDDAAVPLGDGGDLPAAAVPGDGGGELRREPSGNRILDVSALHAADLALRDADRGRRGCDAAGGCEPGPLHPGAAAAPGQQRAGDADIHRRAQRGDFDGDRLDHRAVDHGVQPHRRTADAALSRAGTGCSGPVTCRRCCCRAGGRRWLLILALGYVYFRVSGRSDALAATGLIAFCGVAQFLPALVAGIFWRNATRAGAMAGLTIGFALWCYTLYLPSFGGAFILSNEAISTGPFGIAALRPYALFGVEGTDALVHATAWSLGANTAALVLVSLSTRLTPMERLQGTLFVDAFRSEPSQTLGLVRRSAPGADLFVLAQRILGTDPAAALFRDAAQRAGQARRPAGPDAGLHLAARARARRLGRRGFGPCDGRTDRRRRDDLDGRAGGDRRRERPAHARH